MAQYLAIGADTKGSGLGHESTDNMLCSTVTMLIITVCNSQHGFTGIKFVVSFSTVSSTIFTKILTSFSKETTLEYYPFFS